MSEKILTPCTFDSANRKKDRSVVVKFTTNLEVPNDYYALMDRMVLSDGWLLFSPNELNIEDVPTEEAPSREKKTKLQRLRGVFWHIHQKRKVEEDFEPWWDRQFEKMLDKFKQELD